MRLRFPARSPARAGLNKTDSGTLTLTGSNNYAGQTTVSGGTLELALSAQSPILSGGGVNIQSGHAVFDYTTPGNDPASAINTLLAASYHGGAWDQGQFQSSTQSSTVGLGWADNGTSAVTVQPVLYGDANLDGSVNAADLSKVLTAYGGTGTWATGDFNYDGTVNAADLSKVLTAYGTTGGPAIGRRQSGSRAQHYCPPRHRGPRLAGLCAASPSGTGSAARPVTVGWIDNSTAPKWHGHLGRVSSRAGSPCHKNLDSPGPLSQSDSGFSAVHATASRGLPDHRLA